MGIQVYKRVFGALALAHDVHVTIDEINVALLDGTCYGDIDGLTQDAFRAIALSRLDVTSKM